MSPKTYKYFSSLSFLNIYNPHKPPVYYVMQRPGKGNAGIAASITREVGVQQTRAHQMLVAVAAMIILLECA